MLIDDADVWLEMAANLHDEVRTAELEELHAMYEALVDDQ